MLDYLVKPIQPNEVEWRVITKPKDGRITVAPYIDSRCVMKRLDQQFGPLSWNTMVHIDGDNLTLMLQVSQDGKECTKTDGVKLQPSSDNDQIDPVKSAISDALKRVAVQFGLGRDLYEYPLIQVQSNDRFIPNWAKQKLSNLVANIVSGDFNREYILISQDTSIETPKTQQSVVTSSGKPELDGAKFANMLAAINAGKWKEVEQALPKYNVAPDYEKAIRSQIKAFRSGTALDQVSTKQ
jgi:hypothetical protein